MRHECYLTPFLCNAILGNSAIRGERGIGERERDRDSERERDRDRDREREREILRDW